MARKEKEIVHFTCPACHFRHSVNHQRLADSPGFNCPTAKSQVRLELGNLKRVKDKFGTLVWELEFPKN